MNSRYTELNNELEDVYAMSEDAVCFRYNVDNKAEAIAILQAEIDSIVDDDEENFCSTHNNCKRMRRIFCKFF